MGAASGTDRREDAAESGAGGGPSEGLSRDLRGGGESEGEEAEHVGWLRNGGRRGRGGRRGEARSLVDFERLIEGTTSSRQPGINVRPRAGSDERASSPRRRIAPSNRIRGERTTVSGVGLHFQQRARSEEGRTEAGGAAHAGAGRRMGLQLGRADTHEGEGGLRERDPR